MSKASTKAIRDAMDHAITCYPEESCGYLFADHYEPVKNRAEDRKTGFKIGVRDAARFGDTAIALIHSHPDGPPCPSAEDMRRQPDTGIPGGIILTDGKGAEAPFFFGDQQPFPDLRDRPFRHGVTDCYAAIRDWYRTNRQIDLKDFPRDWEWWTETEEDLYETGFKEAGFYQIEANDAQPGDVFLARIGKTKCINHGGVLINGQGIIYHHLSGRDPFDPSRKPLFGPVGRYHQYIEKWVRYGG